MKASTSLPVEELVDFRKTLHKHPEVSGKEHKTAERVLEFVKKYNPSGTVHSIGGTGIAAIYEGEEEGPVVMFRAELDALPIDEVNDFDHKSEIRNVAHKCGHDGHMSILAGLATHLDQQRPRKGKVILLFQPAEETGEGAERMMADEAFDQLQPDYVFALHNLPGYSRHLIVCRSGSFTSSVNSIVIRLSGKTSHAAEPERGVNPALAISGIIRLAAGMENRNEDEEGFFLITPIQIGMGEEAFGTSAGEGQLAFTLRAFDDATRKTLSEKFESEVKKIAHHHQLKIDIHWEQSFAATENDPEMVALVEKAARSCELNYEQKQKPFRWGEDFGLFTSVYPGAMFGLGAGTSTPALHNPDYDFPDELIPTGTRIFSAIADQLLS